MSIRAFWTAVRGEVILYAGSSFEPRQRLPKTASRSGLRGSGRDAPTQP